MLYIDYSTTEQKVGAVVVGQEPIVDISKPMNSNYVFPSTNDRYTSKYDRYTSRNDHYTNRNDHYTHRIKRKIIYQLSSC